MKTDWLEFYDNRKRFRNMMRGLTPSARESLAWLDTTKAIQNKEGVDHKQANAKLLKLVKSRQQQRSAPLVT